MDGRLAQIIALVAHGNLLLRDSAAGGNEPQIGLAAHSTFKYVSSITFTRDDDSDRYPAGGAVAGSLADWFAFLRANGVSRLWYIGLGHRGGKTQEYVAPAWSESVPYAIQTDWPDRFELWYPLWETGGPSEKPWHVEYRGMLSGHSHALPKRDASAAKAQMKAGISSAADFARRPEVQADSWGTVLDEAVALLDDPHPQPPYHADMLPETGYNLAARQILAAAVKANIFGGMGSWNDMGFGDPALQREYEQVSAELYAALRLGFVVAANAFE
ncbi:MAG: hypothetical protein GYB65_13875 [Chloroflexi bacterium]|nr:hypothetical protein [Chloroflexota bacterium]